MAWPAYEKASRCTTGATPGAKALMAFCLAFVELARNLGIFNCRTVRGASTTSVHGEGRAVDIGFPLVKGRANPLGWVLVRALLPHVGKLGIQCIIWDRMIWSAKSPNGTRYTGTHPHYDHVHIELTWAAAMRLTLATCWAAVSGIAAPAPPLAATPPPYTPPAGPTAEQLLAIQRLLQEDNDMIVIRNGKGIAHLVEGRTVLITATTLVRVRAAYDKANRPLVELELDSDALWRSYTGLG